MPDSFYYVFFPGNSKDYADRSAGGVVANWIGILIVVFGVAVVYLTVTPRFKRLPRPEDGMLLNETNQE